MTGFVKHFGIHSLCQKWGLLLWNQIELHEIWWVLQKSIQSHGVTINCEILPQGELPFSFSFTVLERAIVTYCLSLGLNQGGKPK